MVCGYPKLSGLQGLDQLSGQVTRKAQIFLTKVCSYSFETEASLALRNLTQLEAKISKFRVPDPTFG